MEWKSETTPNPTNQTPPLLFQDLDEEPELRCWAFDRHPTSFSDWFTIKECIKLFSTGACDSFYLVEKRAAVTSN